MQKPQGGGGNSLELGVGSREFLSGGRVSSRAVGGASSSGRIGRAAAVAFCAVVAACAIRSANAAIAFETKNENRNTYTFGTPVDVDNGETPMSNIGSEAEANPGRFTFRAGTVNIKEGGYVRVSSIGDTKDEKNYGNWIGNAGNPATLNISGGTFWAERVGATTGSGFIRIGVSDKGSNTGTARINLSSGWLGADLLKCGGSTYNGASAKNTPAEMNMSGGKAVIDRFQIGASASGSYSSATLNMTGGEMEIGNYFEFCAYHNQSFNWGGGTIAAKKENIFKETSLQANCTRSVTLSGNPSVFDTGNFAQTIPVCIANATGDGTLKLTGGNRVTLTDSPSYNLWLDDGTTLSISDLTIPANGSFTFSGKVTVDGALTLNSGAIIVCNVDAIPSSSVCALTVNDGFMLSDGRSVLDSVVISGADAADYKKSISGNTIMVGKNDDPDYIWNGNGRNWSDADAWNNNGSTSVWYDNYNAIFDFPNATATLDADVIANSLAFNQNATIDGSSTLTVPTVSVAAEVAATISAPTTGALEKTGEGSLTLGSSRTNLTTLTEGTLAMSGGETTLDWSKFTLGTDPDKPVTLRLENGAMPTSGEWGLGRANIKSTVVKAEGDWSRGGDTIVIGNAEGADTTFIHEDGSLTCSGYLIVGGSGAANSTMILSGGAITNSNTATGSTAEPRTAIGYSSDGTLIVTNGASLAVTGQYLGISDANGVKGVVEIYDGSTIDVANAVIFGQVFQQGWGEGELNLHAGGTLSTKTIRCSTKSTPAEATAEVNFDGGTLKALSSMNIIQVHDHLTVNVSEKGGTIDNDGKDISIEECFNGPGTINLIGSGMTTFAAGVGAEGGVSVANGTTLTINGTAQSSFGSLTLAAGSTLALSGVTQSSLGAVTLTADSTIDIATPATDVAVFAATALNLPAEGTVALTSGGGAFGEGLYAICKMSGVTAEAGAKFAPVTGDLVASWSVVDGDTLMLTVGTVDGNTWTGGANNGNLSDPKNWLGGAVPTSGTATINTTGMLTVGDTFRPDVIVFPETCGTVTIKGESAITGLKAVTNLSVSTCTFEVPVAFADKIDVYQTAYYYTDGSSTGDSHEQAGGHVRFAGGVTGTGFAEGTTRCLDGAYTVPATAGWVANTQNNVWTLPDATAAGGSSLTITGSSHDVPGTTDTSMLLMGGGCAFTTGVVRTSKRLSYRIYGEYVVTNELEVALTSDTSIAQRYSAGGKYKFEKLTLSDSGTSDGYIFWLANSTTREGAAKQVYIGAGGVSINAAENKNTALSCGTLASDVTHLYPWHSDYSINGKGGSTRDFIVYRATNLYTDDENGVARKVTLNGIADVRAALTVKGSGKLQVNSNGMNGEGSRIGGITVTDSATLAYASGADLGVGAVTVGANATMELASGAHTFEGGLTLNDGATLAFNFTERTVTPQIALPEGKTPTVNGTVKVKIPADSKWPTGGEKVLTTCGGFTADKVSLAEGAPKWVRGLSVVDGNIVLDVKPMGTKVIVR